MGTNQSLTDLKQKAVHFKLPFLLPLPQKSGPMKKLSLEELNRIDIDTYKKASKTPIVLVLDNIRSLNNIGSIFRTADAFRIECIYLCGITAKPPHRDIHKTALGATESVDWVYVDDTQEAIRKLRQNHYNIIALEQADKSILLDNFHPDPSLKHALILGNEVKGVDQHIVDLADDCIEIPQYGTKHSLNVTVSAGIALWHIFLNIRDL